VNKMVKLFFNGEWFDTDKKKDNTKLKHYYNYSLESKNNLIIALCFALVREKETKLSRKQSKEMK